MKIISNRKWGEIQEEILALKKERQQLLAQVATKKKLLEEAEKKSMEAQLSVVAANKTAKKFEAMYREEKALRQSVEDSRDQALSAQFEAEKFEAMYREEKAAKEAVEQMLVDIRLSVDTHKCSESEFDTAMQAETELRKSNAIKTTKKNATPKKKA